MRFKLFIIILQIIILPFIHCTLPKLDDLSKLVENVPQADDTLIFAQIVFRHGHRTPTYISTYKSDPYKYASNWPFGQGDLIQEGMRGTYRLGLELRQRYGKFIGKTYNPHIVGSVSSSKNRCIESLQCVLAGLFPPNQDEHFLEDLHWRPIAYDVVPKDRDDIFRVYDCDNYFKLNTSITNQTILELLYYLTIHTAELTKDYFDLYNVYHAISGQILLGQKQPEWTKKIYPEPLTSAAKNIYDAFIDQRLEIGASGLYKRIVKYTLDKLNGSLSPPRRKMMLYSGHEQTVVYALAGIKAYQRNEPKVASYVSFELHHVNQTYGIKAYFQNYDNVAPEAINVLGYGEFCPLEKFINGVKWLSESRKAFCEF